MKLSHKSKLGDWQ